MVRHRLACSELRFAIGNYSVQLCEVLQNLAPNLLGRTSARQRPLRRFASRRIISQPNHNYALRGPLQAVRTRGHLPRLQTATQTLGRSRVSKIQVFQNLRRAPLPLRWTIRIPIAHLLDGQRNRVSQVQERCFHSRFSRMRPYISGYKISSKGLP